MTPRLFFAVILSFLLVLCGCNGFMAWFAKEFKQGEVASGIARLSAQHLSIITNEMGKKFKDAKVKTQIIEATEPAEYGKGTVIKTIENEEIVFNDDRVVYEDCVGTKATWRGRAKIVKATQTMYGRLTNNPENPIVPDPNTIKMTIHIIPHNSKIKFSNKDAYIELHDGELSFDAFPRLAQAQAGSLKGLRVIPTSNTRFENVTLRKIKGTLVAEKLTMPFDISQSNYMVQIGVGENGDENKLSGEITAFGNKRHIPTDTNLLAPDYNAHEFVKTYSCKEELSGIVEYKNVAFEEKLGPPMAALSSLAMSKIVSRFVDDHQCGMSSPEFLKNMVVRGEQLEQGLSEARIAQNCVVEFRNYKTEPDCFGIAYEISGDALVTHGQKKVQGLVLYSTQEFADSIRSYENLLLANNITDAMAMKPEAIVPVTRQPGVVDVSADVSNLVIKEICVSEGSLGHKNHCNNQEKFSPMEFSLSSGKLSGTIKPLMAKGTDPADGRAYNVCAVKNIPIAEMDMALTSVTAGIKKSGNEFKLRADGVYRAVSGFLNGHENELSGYLTVGKVKVPFEDNNNRYVPLKPDYERSVYEDSFQSCRPNKFIIPETDDDCSVTM